MPKTTKRMMLLLLILFTILLLVGIGVYFYGTLQKTAKNDTFHIEDVPTADDLQDMVEAADDIVIGEYEGLHSTINLVRDNDDPAQESDEFYLGGKLFRFHPEETLKGDIGKDEILVAHRYSDEFPIGEILGRENKEVDEADPTYITPAFGKKYIIFINEEDDVDYYTQSLEPYLITVNEEDIVEVKSNIEEELDFDDTISGEALPDLINEIEALK